MKKLFAAAVISAMVLAMAAPATADDSGVGTYQGTAKVGQTFDDPGTTLVVEGCGGSGVPTAGVFGNGLRFPDPAQLGGINGVWALGTTVTGLPAGGALNICGELGQNAAGIGASCGMSEGRDGRGKFGANYTLSNVGWTTSAGGTLPVSGTWTNPGNGHTGTLVALTQAQGGSDCATAGGAKSFTVVGVTALL
jgi:hypothetical protein